MSDRDKKYGAVATTLEEAQKEPQKGYSYWIEWGNWYKCPIVDPTKFGGHDYDNGGYERGIHNCTCGCYMGESHSSGPCDPFGACPENPIPTELHNVK